MNPMWRDFAIFTTITVEVVGFTGVGMFLGRWLSEGHGFPRWTMAVTALLGLGTAVYRVVRRVSRTQRAQPLDTYEGPDGRPE